MKIKLHWQIVIALVLALLSGLSIRLWAAHHGMAPVEAGSGFIAVCSFAGRLFFNALKMIVVPLITASIITGMMGIGGDRHFGRLGIKTLSYYLLSGLAAILTGLILVNLIQPGQVDEATAQAILNQASNPDTFLQKIEGRGGADLLELFIRMIPMNVIHAASQNNQLLGLIFFSLLFGYFICRLPPALRRFQEDLWESILGVMTGITDWVIRFTPYGVFGLICPIIIETGFEAFLPLSLFFITVLLGLGIHLFVTLPLALRFFGIRPSAHFRAVSPALLTAFSTASSASTLPVTLECVQENAGVSKRISSFTLPLGATVNMDGTALYECVVVIFIAQFYAVAEGIQMGLATQFQVVLMALLTSVGVAGIPSASLVAIAVILGSVGLPLEAIGIVMVVDRILDMCRTSVNVFSDTCGAALIAASENETLSTRIPKP